MMDVGADMARPFDALGFAGTRLSVINAAIILLFAYGSAFAQSSLVVVSAADYLKGPLTPGSIVSIFAVNKATGAGESIFSTGIFVAQDPPPAPLPLSLGGVSATIQDELSGTTEPISLLAVTPSQVNAVLPGWLPDSMPMIVSLTTSSGVQIVGFVSMAWTSPSLFTADESGQGVPAAQLVIAHADGSQTFIGSIANCTGGKCTPVPINLGSSTDTAVLELFGTGMRGMAALCGSDQSCIASYPLVPVEVIASGYSVFGVSVATGLTVLYVGAQGAGAPGSFYGLDQVNVILPYDTFPSGPVNLRVTVLSDPTMCPGPLCGTGYQYSNTVTIDIQ